MFNLKIYLVSGHIITMSYDTEKNMMDALKTFWDIFENRSYGGVNIPEWNILIIKDKIVAIIPEYYLGATIRIE